jgi:hypothetical protein
MAIKSKTQLGIDIGASTFTAPQKVILDDMVDSYEDIFAQMDTATRDALTPVLGQVIFNTDNIRYEYWNGVVWFGIGQDLSTPLVVKVSLSSAEILALDTVAKVLVTAPGATYALMPISMAYRFTYGSIAYAGSYSIGLKSTTKTTADPFLVITSTTMNAAANRSGSYPTNTGASIDAIVENDSLELKSNAAISAGDGTLEIWLTYSIINY